MSSAEKADWETVDPFENDEVRTESMFEEKEEEGDEHQVWLCVAFTDD